MSNHHTQLLADQWVAQVALLSARAAPAEQWASRNLWECNGLDEIDAQDMRRTADSLNERAQELLAAIEKDNEEEANL